MKQPEPANFVYVPGSLNEMDNVIVLRRGEPEPLCHFCRSILWTPLERERAAHRECEADAYQAHREAEKYDDDGEGTCA